MAQLLGVQNSGSFTLGTDGNGGAVMTEHRFTGAISSSDDLKLIAGKQIDWMSGSGDYGDQSVANIHAGSAGGAPSVSGMMTITAMKQLVIAQSATQGSAMKVKTQQFSLGTGPPNAAPGLPDGSITLDGSISASGDIHIGGDVRATGSLNGSTLIIENAFAANDSGGAGTFQVKGGSDDFMIVGNAVTDYVGIGIVAAEEKLHVEGNITGSGNIQAVTGSFDKTSFPGGILAYMEQVGQGTVAMSKLTSTSWSTIVDTYNVSGVGNFSYTAKCQYYLPRSGYALVRFRVFVDQPGYSAPTLYLRLTDSGGTSLGSKYERRVQKVDESDDNTLFMEWVVANADWSVPDVGANADVYIQVKTSSNVNAPTLYWGGSGADSYPNMTIEIIELPSPQTGKTSL